jgi:hypothetical protein
MGDVITWVDPDGEELTFTLGQDGPTGRLMPPIQSVTERVPGQAGARLRSTRHEVRKVAFTGLMFADDAVTQRVALRDLARLLDPIRGDGRLRVDGPDASSREITCRYVGDLDRAAEQLAAFQELPLVFEAVDPYWYDAADVVSDFTIGATTTFFPIFPIVLSSSEVFADLTIDNTGDVAAWPVFTFTGPGNAIVGRNFTTEKMFSLTNPTSLAVAAGESVTVDTRADLKSVTRNDDTNQFSYLTSTSTLWELAKGLNSIRLEMGGATAGSGIRVAYRRRFLTP